MKTLFFKSFLLTAGIFSVLNTQGQIRESYLDSIELNKPKVNKNLYQFRDDGAREIQYSYEKTELVRNRPNQAVRDVGNGVMTALTGIGFNSSTEGSWKIPAIIKCNDNLSDWIVNLFCEGSVQKERERVRNSDGSWSVETNKTNLYNWNKNATGIIVEGNDTIGLFMIVMNPREDKLLSPLYENNMPKQQIKNTNSLAQWTEARLQSSAADFGITGKIREKDFIICRNGSDRKAWIFTDNVIRCIFQEDHYYGVSKKNRIMPYILINKNFTGLDKRDLFRLAIMSRLMNEYLSPY